MNKIVPFHPGSPYEAFADHGLLVFPPPTGVEIESFAGPAIQLPDGKIFVAFIRTPGVQLELWRFTADGMPDQGYGNGGGLQIPDSGFFRVTDVATLADGKILVYGVGREQTTVRLIRVTSEGALDPGFGDDGIAWASIPIGMSQTMRIALLPDGQVIGSGHGLEYPSGTSWLVRFTANGKVDHLFGKRGIVLLEAVGLRGPLVVVESGHILATGFIDGGSALVAKYRFDGSPEPTFGIGGYVSFVRIDGRPAALHALALQPDGKLVAVGKIGILGLGEYAVDAVVLRLNSDGALDDTFNDGQPLLPMTLGVDANDASAVAIQADGRIVVGGQIAASVEGVLFRLEESGALDHSFGLPNFGGDPGYRGFTYTLRAGFFDRVSRLALTSDGNVLVLGTTEVYQVPFVRQYLSKYSL